jgi:hypothetical protein
MRRLTVEPHQAISPPTQPNSLKAAGSEARRWLTHQLGPHRPRLTRVRVATICAAIFVLAVGVRVLHWQDSHEEIVGGKVSLSGVFERYRKEAQRIIEEGGVLFPREWPDLGNARMLAHPPGYSILLARLYTLNDDIVRSLWFVQIVGAGLAAVLVFMIATELLGWGLGLISAMLIALSPHLAYYSLILTPDSLTVLPILCAIYLVIKAFKRPRIIYTVSAGSLIGLSCWLTSNAMLLAPFLGVVTFFIFERSRRMILSATVVGSMLIVIAPLTVRNAIVFHRFVPLSIQAGLSLVEGIGDYDKEGRLGMPRSDREARQKDAEWNGRADYSSSLWYPDGIDRDHIRLSRGMEVIRSNPAWFMGVCLRRAAFMLRYNDSRAYEFPFNTAQVPRVLAESPYGHPLEINNDLQPMWGTHPVVLVLNGSIIPRTIAVTNDREPVTSISPDELNAKGAVVSQQATVSLLEAGQMFQLAGDNSEYGDQFASAAIPVKENTDYVLVLPVNMLAGDMALKVTSPNRRIALAASALAVAAKEKEPSSSSELIDDASGAPEMTAIQMPFATAARTEIRIVLSNNGATPTLPAVQLGKAELFELGATPHVWTRYPRLIVRSIQRRFTTVLLIGLILLGVALLLLARHGRTLVILLAVPAYYLLVQSPLHTEYRYILAIHYFLFISAGVTVYMLAAALSQAARLAARHLGVGLLKTRL